MVLIAEKQLEQVVDINDSKNVTVLGVDQGCFLLFSANTTSWSRNASNERTFIGSVHLITKEQKILYRHSSAIKISHASINAARTLCCFVKKTEPNIFEVFMAEIDPSTAGRLFSLNYSRSSSIRAYLTAHDVVLIFYRDLVTVFPISFNSKAIDGTASVDRAAQLDQCVYFQWDPLIQRLHIIQRRTLNSVSTLAYANTNQRPAYIYTMYIVSNRGQFESIMTADFDLETSDQSLNHLNFEILSNEASIYLCWQSTIREDVKQIKYAVVSLGHGRSIYISRSLNPDTMELFQSRKVHFGLLPGDYMFAFLRGEFIHILDWNIHSKFANHLFLPNRTDDLPYDTKYTSQRGLMDKTLTLLYEKKNLITYTMRMDPNAFLQYFSPSTFHAIIGCSIFPWKDNFFLPKILEKILTEMADDLNTKTYLKEILTALIFNRLAGKIYNLKYRLAFPSTMAMDRPIVESKFSYRPVTHHLHSIPKISRVTTVDKEYCDILCKSFALSHRYRDKLPYRHEIVNFDEDSDALTNTSNTSPGSPRRVSLVTPPPSNSPGPGSRRQTGRGSFFTFGSAGKGLAKSPEEIDRPRKSTSSPFTSKDKLLEAHIKESLQKLHKSWEESKIDEFAREYVVSIRKQTNRLIQYFTQLAGFNPTQALTDDDADKATTQKYAPLLTIIEKLYSAVLELGFPPTEDLERILSDISFRVLPFEEFVKAIDQKLLVLTEEFVTRVILEFDDREKFYTMKEQLIYMLPDTDPEIYSRLFSLIKDDRGKRTAAQLLIAQRLSREDHRNAGRNLNSADFDSDLMLDGITDMMNLDDTLSSQSRFIEQALVTFFRDCKQRGDFGEDEMQVVKDGLLASALSQTP